MFILVLFFTLVLGAAPALMEQWHIGRNAQQTRANTLAQVLAAEHLAAMETCKFTPASAPGCVASSYGQRISSKNMLNQEIATSALYRSDMFVSVSNGAYIISFIDPSKMNSKGGTLPGQVVQQLINNTGQVVGVGYYDVASQSKLRGELAITCLFRRVWATTRYNKARR